MGVCGCVACVVLCLLSSGLVVVLCFTIALLLGVAMWPFV